MGERPQNKYRLYLLGKKHKPSQAFLSPTSVVLGIILP